MPIGQTGKLEVKAQEGQLGEMAAQDNALGRVHSDGVDIVLGEVQADCGDASMLALARQIPGEWHRGGSRSLVLRALDFAEQDSMPLELMWGGPSHVVSANTRTLATFRWHGLAATLTASRSWRTARLPDSPANENQSRA